jgi:glycosyltransferase involved in cell wall biosynthesis
MNIALFASAFHPHLGGVEELCRQLAHAYKRRGMGVIVLTNRWPRSLPAFEEVEGIPVRRLAMRVPDGAAKAHLTYRLTGGRVTRQVVEIIRQHRADVLHVQCVSCNAHYALAAKAATRLPLVVSLQGELGMDAGRLFQRSEYARELMRRSLDAADVVTACSGQTLQEGAAFVGRPLAGFGRVIFNGVRLADFDGVAPHVHPRPYVFAIGRHVPQKGFDLLLRAFSAAGDLGHDLLLAGDGFEQDRLRALAASLPAAARIKFLGRVSHDQAVRLFAGCSFFTLPSRHEPQGIVNLEAMAAGKAVLASRVGGVPEIVLDERTGVLLDPNDQSDWIRALRDLCVDSGKRQRFGDAGRCRAREFDWDQTASRYVEAYQDATRGALHGVGAVAG